MSRRISTSQFDRWMAKPRRAMLITGNSFDITCFERKTLKSQNRRAELLQ
jgi:hypothetical protein